MYVRITGKRALFARPEMRAERYSYEVITPSAAVGLLRCIYWKPEMKYVIQNIYTYKVPGYEVIKTNDTTLKPTAKQVLSSDGFYAKEYQTSRTAVILTDVEYVVEFSIKLTGTGTAVDDSIGKHETIFTRRIKKGQFFEVPHLGAKEFPAEVELLDTVPESPFHGVKDLGLMLHHMDFDKTVPAPVWFHAVMRDGKIDTFSPEVFHTEGIRHGWVFQELCTQYKRKEEEYGLPPFGYSREKIFFVATINEAGRMVSFEPIHTDEKGKILPVFLNVPAGVKGRTSGIKANFLWDVPAYAVGWMAKGKDCSDKFRAFKKKALEILDGETLEETAFLNYLKNGPDMTLIEPYAKEMELSRKIVFRLEGHDRYIHDNDIIKEKWKSYHKCTMGGTRGICMVSGNEDVIAELHPMITGVANTKQNNGKLVSIDRNNGKTFESYGAGKCLSESTAMGEVTCHEYSVILNYYLSSPKHRVIINGITFVFWSESDDPSLIDKIRYFLTGGREDRPEKTCWTGEKFYILGLAPNVSGGIRIGVRYFCEFVDRKNNGILNFARRLESLYSSNTMQQDWEFMKEWEGLEVSKKSNGMLLGELFAVLDKIQMDAVESTKLGRTSIAYRYMDCAKRTPARCMNRLVSNSYAHTKKTDKYGLGRRRDELIDQIGEEGFPEKLTPYEQSMFQLGFVRQRKAFYQKKEKTEKEN